MAEDEEDYGGHLSESWRKGHRSDMIGSSLSRGPKKLVSRFVRGIRAQFSYPPKHCSDSSGPDVGASEERVRKYVGLPWAR